MRATTEESKSTGETVDATHQPEAINRKKLALEIGRQVLMRIRLTGVGTYCFPSCRQVRAASKNVVICSSGVPSSAPERYASPSPRFRMLCIHFVIDERARHHR